MTLDLTAPTSLTTDLPCRKCGYNLRGLTPDGRCPECGTPVGFSLQGDLLRFSNPDWLDNLRRGATTVILGIATYVIGSISLTFVAALVNTRASRDLAGVVNLIAAAFVLFGWWWLTQPDPSGLGEDQYGTSRKIIRVMLAISAAGQLFQLVGNRFIDDRATLFFVATVVVPAVGISQIVAIFAHLRYLARLAKRIPDAKLAARANFLFYALGISYGTLLIFSTAIIQIMLVVSRTRPANFFTIYTWVTGVFGLTVLVFGIMYLLLLEKLRRQFKAQAAIARQTWAATPFTPPPTTSTTPRA
jgi:hypothetical protein